MAVTAIYKGSTVRTDIVRAYKGTTLIYESVPSVNYVRFVSAESRTITPKYDNSGITLQYSVDSGSTWTTIASGSSTTSATEHWFRGQATGTKGLFTGNNSTNAWEFSGSSDLEVYGNLNFLLCDTLGDTVAPTSLANYCYSQMFYGCTALITAPELPATTLATAAYREMFRGCTSLVNAPELPATTLVTSCYSSMFYGCISLTVAPELPATTLAQSCYSNMFQGCTSLTTAPTLPATTLATSCYYYMFRDCTALTTAPELPATTLVNSCYRSMFQGCSSLKVSATNTGSYTYAWRIPTSGTGITATNWNINMLTSTGGTFTSYPSINTTYYVENQPV